MSSSTLPITGVGIGDTHRAGIPTVANAAWTVAPTGADQSYFSRRTAAYFAGQNGATADFIFTETYDAAISLNVPFYFGDGRMATGLGGGDQSRYGIGRVTNAALDFSPPGWDSAKVSRARTWHYIENSGASVDFVFADEYVAETPLNTPFYFGPGLVVSGAGVGDLLKLSSFNYIRTSWMVHAPSIAAPKAGKPRIGSQPAVDFYFTETYDAATPLNVPFYFGPGLTVTAVGTINSFKSGLPRVVNAAFSAAPLGFVSGKVSRARMSRPAPENSISGASVDFGFNQANYVPWTPLNTPFYFQEPNRLGIFPINELPLGVPTVTNKAVAVRPWGIKDTGYGTPEIRTLNQTIRAGGIVSQMAVGKPKIAPRVPIKPEWEEGALFGNTMVAFYRRHFEVPGIAPIPVTGSVWVSHSPRIVDLHLQGFNNATFYSLHQVGYHRHADPEGFDAQLFGQTAVRDNTQWLYPQGLYEIFPDPVIYNRIQYITPEGFLSTKAENQRYGLHWLWNSRQYIQQRLDPEDQYQGERFGKWTGVANRSATIATFGLPTDKFGYPLAYNNARLVAPKAIPSQDPGEFYKSGEVSHRIRFLPLTGIAPHAIPQWSVIYNAARVILPKGLPQTNTWGRPTAAEFGIFKAGKIDSLSFGPVMIGDAVRTVTQKWPADPPAVQMPRVWHGSRYILPKPIQNPQVGGPDASIHFNRASTFGKRFDVFGSGVIVRNLTPEVRTWGLNHEEFGEASLRTQWRHVTTIGDAASLFGKAWIKDRRQWIEPFGLDPVLPGDTLVTRLGPEPPSLQKIFPSSFPAEDEDTPFGLPRVGSTVIYVAAAEEQTLWGKTRVTSNVIRINVGIGDTLLEFPMASHKIRKIFQGETKGTLAWGKPRFSPHTIYAVNEAPAKYAENNPGKRGNYVDYYGNPEKGVGYPLITMQHRAIRPEGFESKRFGMDNDVSLWIRRLAVPGFRPFRSGGHTVLGGDIEQPAPEGIPSAAAFGNTTVKFPPYTGPQYLNTSGPNFQLFGATEIMNFHRSVGVQGIYSQRFGESGGSPRYMPQRLVVHFPDWPEMQGFESEQFGTAWASHYIREVQPQGDDMFISDYDVLFFKERMRVRNALSLTPPAQTVGTYGITSAYGIPDVNNSRRVIRPDGNTETFRQGAFQ